MTLPGGSRRPQVAYGVLGRAVALGIERLGRDDAHECEEAGEQEQDSGRREESRPHEPAFGPAPA